MSRVIRDDKRILDEMSDVEIAYRNISNKIIQVGTEPKQQGWRFIQTCHHLD